MRLGPFWKGFGGNNSRRKFFLETLIWPLRTGRNLPLFDKNRHCLSDKIRRSDRLVTGPHKLNHYLHTKVETAYR